MGILTNVTSSASWSKASTGATSVGRKALHRLNGNLTKRSRQTKQPVHIEGVDGPMFKGAEGWRMLMRLPVSPSYSGKSLDDQAIVLSGITSVLQNIVGKAGRLYITSVPYNAERKRQFWLQQCRIDANDTEALLRFRQRIDRDTRTLKREQFRVRVTWIEVSLDDYQLSGNDIGLTQDQYDVGMSEYGILDPNNHRLIAKVEAIARAIKRVYPDAALASRDQVLEHIIRAKMRGVTDPPIPQFDPRRPINQPNQLAWLGDSCIVPYEYHVDNLFLDRTGYVAYLTLGVLPSPGIPMPTYEFLWINDMYGNPVDIVVNFDVLTADQALTEIEIQQAKLDAWRDGRFHRRAGDDKQPRVYTAQEAISAATVAADERREPRLTFSVIAAVTGPTAEDCRANAQYVISSVAQAYPGVIWYTPAGRQEDLHNSVQPGELWSATEWLHRTPLEGLAAGGAIVTSVPAVNGNLHGHLTSRDPGPFEIDLTSVLKAGQEDRTVTVIGGNVGGGKSSAIYEILLAMAHNNNFAIYREGHHNELKHVNWDRLPHPRPPRTTIAIDEIDGGFNPAWWGETPGDQISNVTSFLLQTAHSPNKDDRSVIVDYAKQYIESHPDYRDLGEIVQLMRDSNDKDAKAVSRKILELTVLPRTEYLRGTREQASYLFDNLQPGFIGYETESWRLPKRDAIDPVYWTPQQRLALACTNQMFSFGYELGRRRDCYTITADDEFASRSHLPVTRAALHEVATTGRKYNNLQLLSTPSLHPRDVPRECLDYASHAIVFRTVGKTDAKWAARYLRFEDPEDPQVIRSIQRLGCDRNGRPDPRLIGECFVRYPNGDLARGKFDRLNLGEAFEPRKNTPPTPPSGDPANTGKQLQTTTN